MPANDDQESFLSDRPLQDPKDDRLGYALFAEHMADSLLAMDSEAGLVVGLFGPWGCGKTTIINFILHYLETKKSTTDRPIVVRFNPWWFSSGEDLLHSFLSEALTTLARDPDDAQKRKDAIAAIMKIASHAPVPGLGSLDAIGDLLRERKTMPAMKTDFTRALRSCRLRLLVVMDDIDRLAPPEIKQVFRIVKSICDFSSVTYILAFDREVVSEALSAELGIPGQQYLEKIVQIPIDIPLPDKPAIRRMLGERLEFLLAETPSELFEEDRWHPLYREGIDPLISQPRHVVRIHNALQMSYPPVRNEVNAVDFIAMETIRLLLPSVYDTIRHRPDLYINDLAAKFETESRKKERGAFYDRILDELPENQRGSAKRLLCDLFPRADALMKRYTHGPGFEEEWRRSYRVCCAEVFPTYFRLAVPEGGVSRTELVRLVGLSNDRAAFGEALRQLTTARTADGHSRARAVLDRFNDLTRDEVPLGSVATIVGALLDVGDEVIGADERDVWGIEGSNDLLIWWIVKNLLTRLGSEERARVLSAEVATGGISTVAMIVHGLAIEHEAQHDGPSTRAEERLVDAATLSNLIRVLAERLDSLDASQLVALPDLAHVLYRWKAWGHEERLRNAVREALADPALAPSVLQAFIRRTARTNLETGAQRVSEGFVLSEAVQFCEEESLRACVSKLEEVPDVPDSVKRIVALVKESLAASAKPIGTVGPEVDRPTSN